MVFTTLEDTKLDDTALMHMLALKDGNALSDLYDRYGRLVYSIALNSVGDQNVAEEIVQDVFTRVWEKADTYNAGIAKVSTWIITITRNRAIDELRKSKARRENSSISWAEIDPYGGPSSPGPEEEAELSMQQKLVSQALERLSPHQRELLAMAYFKGYTQTRIAQVLSMPLGTVKTQIRAAIQKLRVEMVR